MLDSRDSFEPFDEVEGLVRSARDYVRPTEDLRPRVLEAARRECREQRALGYLRFAAVFVLLLGLSVAALREQFEVLGRIQSASVAAAVADLLVPAEVQAPTVDVHWHVVDSFTELRRRQAELLRAAPEFHTPKFQQPDA